MKKKPATIRIARETLRNLETPRLPEVHGGARVTAAKTCLCITITVQVCCTA